LGGTGGRNENDNDKRVRTKLFQVDSFHRNLFSFSPEQRERVEAEQQQLVRILAETIELTEVDE